MANQPLVPVLSTPNPAGGVEVGITATSAVNASTADTVTLTVPDGHNIGGRKILVGYDIKVAYADVVAILDVQGSVDGTNWTKLVEVDDDMTPNVTGATSVSVDLSDIFCPYYRIIANRSGLNMGTSGTMVIYYAAKYDLPRLTYGE
jgi:hypothetical protein